MMTTELSDLRRAPKPKTTKCSDCPKIFQARPKKHRCDDCQVEATRLVARRAEKNRRLKKKAERKAQKAAAARSAP